VAFDVTYMGAGEPRPDGTIEDDKLSGIWSRLVTAASVTELVGSW